MKAQFKSDLVTKELIGSKYCQLTEEFMFYSDILKRDIIVPVGFICDYESVPLIKASSKRGGVIHDYLCRIDSVPCVSKQIAADVYLEAQRCRDFILNEGWFKPFTRWIRRRVKTLVVRVAPGYFRKFLVMATLEDLTS